jgi:hypothetical protein
MAKTEYELWVKGNKKPMYTGDMGACMMMKSDLMYPQNPAWAESEKNISIVPKGEKPQFK